MLNVLDDNNTIKESYQNIETFDGFLNIALVDGDKGDQEAGTDHYNFKYVPELTISAGLSKRFGALSISSVANYRSNAIGPEQNIDSSIINNLSINYMQTLTDIVLNHTFRIDNIFDKQAFIAEHVRRRGVNQLPLEIGRSITYEILFTF